MLFKFNLNSHLAALAIDCSKSINHFLAKLTPLHTGECKSWASIKRMWECVCVCVCVWLPSCSRGIGKFDRTQGKRTTTTKTTSNKTERWPKQKQRQPNGTGRSAKSQGGAWARRLRKERHHLQLQQQRRRRRLRLRLRRRWRRQSLMCALISGSEIRFFYTLPFFALLQEWRVVREGFGKGRGRELGRGGKIANQNELQKRRSVARFLSLQLQRRRGSMQGERQQEWGSEGVRGRGRIRGRGVTLLAAAPVVVVVARAIGSKSRRTSEWPRKEE